MSLVLTFAFSFTNYEMMIMTTKIMNPDPFFIIVNNSLTVTNSANSWESVLKSGLIKAQPF